MALIQWKQLDTDLTGSVYTGSFNVSGSIVLNGVNISSQGSIFTQTGSYWNTTRNVGITGSLQLNFNPANNDYFAVSVSGQEKVRINTEGIIQLAPQDVTPTAVTGGIYYSGSDEYFLGFI